MKIELKRKTKIDSFYGIMKIKVFEEKPELVQFLKLGKNENESIKISDIKKRLNIEELPDTIIKRTIKTLQDMVLLDADGNLTDLGRKSVKLGKIPEGQEGLFQLWYNKDYDIFIHIKRKNVNDKHKENSIEVEKPKYNKDKIICSWINNDYDDDIKEFMIRYIDLNKIKHDKNTSCDADFNIILEKDLEKDTIEIKPALNGEIVSYNEKSETKALNIQSNDDILMKIFKNFNVQVESLLEVCDLNYEAFSKKYKAVMISLKDLPNQTKSIEEGHIENVSIKTDDNKINIYNKDYEISSVKYLPVMPSSEEDAHNWFNYTVKNKIQNYITPQNLKEYCEEVVSNKVFRAYNMDNLIKTDSEENAKLFISNNKKDLKSEELWFYQAPIDLQLEKYEGVKAMLNIKKDEKPSVKNIIDKLNILGNNEIDFVCIYDPYIINPYARKICSLWIKSLGVSKDRAYLFTLTNKKDCRRDDPSILKNSLRKEVCKNVFFVFEEKEIDSYHDRYIWIRYKNDSDIYFKLSNSLNFVRFASGIKPQNIENGTKPYSNKDITIYKQEKDIFPKDIIQKINELEQNKNGGR